MFTHSKSTNLWAQRFCLPSRILCFWNFSDKSRHCWQHLKHCETALQQTQSHRSLGSFGDYRTIETWDDSLKIWGADFFGPALNDDSYINVRLTKWIKSLICLHNSARGFDVLTLSIKNFCKVSRDALQSTPRRGHFDVLPLLYLRKLTLKGFNVDLAQTAPDAAGHSRDWCVKRRKRTPLAPAKVCSGG